MQNVLAAIISISNSQFYKQFFSGLWVFYLFVDRWCNVVDKFYELFIRSLMNLRNVNSWCCPIRCL